jgi:hypothetical protein
MKKTKELVLTKIISPLMKGKSEEEMKQAVTNLKRYLDLVIKTRGTKMRHIRNGP